MKLINLIETFNRIDEIISTLVALKHLNLNKI